MDGEESHEVLSPEDDQTLSDLKKLKESIDSLSSSMAENTPVNGNVNGRSGETSSAASPVAENGHSPTLDAAAQPENNSEAMETDVKRENGQALKDDVKDGSVEAMETNQNNSHPNDSDVMNISSSDEDTTEKNLSGALDKDKSPPEVDCKGSPKVNDNKSSAISVGEAKSDNSVSSVKKDTVTPEKTAKDDGKSSGTTEESPPSADKDKLRSTPVVVEDDDDDVVVVGQDAPATPSPSKATPTANSKPKEKVVKPAAASSGGTPKPSMQSDNLRPMAKMLYDLGLDLARQQVYKDLIKIQKKKSTQSKLGDKEEKQLNKLKVAYDNILTKNDPYQMDMTVCDMCGFNSESTNVMELHKEFAHHRSDGSNTCECAFCDFVAPSGMPSMFFLHMENNHGRKGRIHMRLANFTCPFCPFENNSKRAYMNHIQRCEKKFNLGRNLEPSSNDSDIPLMQVKRPAPPLAPRPTIAPPRLSAPPPRGTSQQPRPTAPGVLSNIRGSIVPVPNSTGPGGQQLFQVGSSLYTLVHSQGQAFLAPVVPGTAGLGVQNSAQQQVNRSGVAPTNKSAPPMPKGQAINTIRSILGKQASGATAQVAPQPKPKPTKSIPQPKASVAGPNFEICEICGGFVKDRESLRIHFFYAHKVELSPEVFNNAEGPVLKCEMCAQRFWTYQGVVRHTQTQHGSKASNVGGIMCGICGENNLPMGMLGHLVARHNVSIRRLIEINKCFLCKVSFPVHFLLKMHMLKSHKDIIPSSSVFAAFLKSLGLSKAFMPVASSETSPKANAGQVNSGMQNANRCDSSPGKHGVPIKVSEMLSRKRRLANERPEVETLVHVQPSDHPHKCSRCDLRFPFQELMQKHYNDVHRNEKEKCELCESVIMIGRPMVRHMKREHIKQCSVVLTRLPRKQYFYHVSKYRKRAEAAAKRRLEAAAAAAVDKNVDSSKQGTECEKDIQKENVAVRKPETADDECGPPKCKKFKSEVLEEQDESNNQMEGVDDTDTSLVAMQDAQDNGDNIARVEESKDKTDIGRELKSLKDSQSGKQHKMEKQDSDSDAVIVEGNANKH